MLAVRGGRANSALRASNMHARPRVARLPPVGCAPRLRRQATRARAPIDYEFRDRPPVYADIPVESVHLSTVDDQFARVTIRYSGANAHAQVLQFLERSYGRIERLPGQMMRGLNQQYTWRGPDTEISLTYEANRDRGFIFIESRNLAPRFQDRMSDTAD